MLNKSVEGETMYYPDYHIHSRFSDDCEAAPEDIIEQAIVLGMPAICLTDHHDTNSPDGDFHLDPVAYPQEIERLRALYADRIEIVCGVEVGIDADLSKEHVTETFLSQGHFDYVIASLHYMEGKDPYYRDTFDCNDEELYEKYYTYLLEALRHTTGITTVGHLDYIVRYARDEKDPHTYPRFRELIDALLEETIRRGLILEINTYSKAGSGMRMHPAPEILRRYKEMGGERIVLGSDAHKASLVGGKFFEAAAMAREIGFTHLTLINRDGEKELPL